MCDLNTYTQGSGPAVDEGCKEKDECWEFNSGMVDNDSARLRGGDTMGMAWKPWRMAIQE
jgi:hypothetical protein